MKTEQEFLNICLVTKLDLNRHEKIYGFYLLCWEWGWQGAAGERQTKVFDDKVHSDPRGVLRHREEMYHVT